MRLDSAPHRNASRFCSGEAISLSRNPINSVETDGLGLDESEEWQATD